MEDLVLALAMELGGVEEGEAASLSFSCRMAVRELTSLLKSGVEPEDCGETFADAAARLALADWLALRKDGQPKKFTAGDVTVEENTIDPAGLRKQALRQMAHWLKDPGFSFRRVRT